MARSPTCASMSFDGATQAAAQMHRWKEATDGLDTDGPGGRLRASPADPHPADDDPGHPGHRRPRGGRLDTSAPRSTAWADRGAVAGTPSRIPWPRPGRPPVRGLRLCLFGGQPPRKAVAVMRRSPMTERQYLPTRGGSMWILAHV